MTDDYADTVTPLDGDGLGVVEPTTPGDIPDTGNVPVGEYETQGKTTVATRRGYAFASNDKEIPVVTHAGLKTNKETAEALIEESHGLVFIKNEED